MKLIIKPFHSLPCKLEVFTINGIAANSRDFGDVYDHNEKAKEPYGCVDIVASYVRNCYDIYIDGNKILKDIKYCHQLQHFLFGLGLNHEMEV